MEYPALIAMVGPAGSGKSTYAARCWPGRVLALDDVREWISGDAGDQTATAQAVPVWHAELAARLHRDGLVVADATNVEPEHRAELLRIARAAGASAVAVLLDVELAEALARNATRPTNRRVPAATVAWQHDRARGCAEHLVAEGWQVRVVRDAKQAR